MSVISKTTFTFTVLHRTDEPFTGVPGGFGTLDGALGEAMARSQDGNAVGMETDQKTVEVADLSVEDELVALGNDGSFFDTDLEEGAICPRHGGTWGEDETCRACTYEDGGVREWGNKGPLTDG